MSFENNKTADHERFRELAALASSGTLSEPEDDELRAHLMICPDCERIYREYLMVRNEAIPVLAGDHPISDDQVSWDGSKAESRLFSAIHQRQAEHSRRFAFLPGRWKRPALVSVLAACVLVVVSVSSFHSGKYFGRTQVALTIPQPTYSLAEEESLKSQLAAESATIEILKVAAVEKQHQIDAAQRDLRSAENRSDEARRSDTEQVQALIGERDSLAKQLRVLQQEYKTVEDELNTSEQEREGAALRLASLQSDVDRLNGRLREEDRSVQDRDQYLASDRDIRELMGARQLYIADVFDVDKNGRMRQPFGRVFYTKGKSLIFYAFDLDRQPGFKNAGVFQAWGERTAEGAKPLKLGVLYMDNEANRRWALRFDDPDKLAEIDAVFVTLEAGKGNESPTGKRFLYASLRKMPNHP